jgi:hypothetical protein
VASYSLSLPDLAVDPMLRKYIKWTLERLYRDLLKVGGNDPIALNLAKLAIVLIDLLADVTPLMPRRDELDRRIVKSTVIGEAFRRGLEAIAWIVDERGLGGGNERDGLAWIIPLEKLWESYVESIYRKKLLILVGGKGWSLEGNSLSLTLDRPYTSITRSFSA